MNCQKIVHHKAVDKIQFFKSEFFSKLSAYDYWEMLINYLQIKNND